VNSTQFVVPTELERTGDFSEIGTVSASGTCISGTCIKNIATGAYYPNIRSLASIQVGQAIINSYPHPKHNVTAKGVANFNGTILSGPGR